MFGQAMNPIIRSDGSPRFAMVTTVAGAIFNIIFDPVMIFGLKWGMTGAAIATVLGQFITAAFAAYYLFNMKAVRLRRASWRPDFLLLKKFLPMGLCSLLAQISLVVSMAVVNNMVKKYSALDAVFREEQYAQIPMAVIGIVMKFFQIVISVVIGMAAGCIPIVGYNIGAKRADRAKKIFTRLLITEALIGFFALIVVEFFPNNLIRVFGAANESVYYTDFALKTFRIYLCLVVFACVNKAAFIFLQSLGKPWVSTFLSMIREVILGTFFPALLPVYFGLRGILCSMPAADGLTFVISAIVIYRTYKELNNDTL